MKGSRYNVGRLLLIGLVFHLVYIASVFDCYFTSPVVKGMTPMALASSEAKRLVLIVGDGLRADLLFSLNPFPNVPESPRVVAPYLRDIVESRGAFGISHTRVPTESRPGHVAIIAGMYEDVSAVTKGWKTNPVDFDSVFNQSSTTFSFGSPDILPMFARGAIPGKVRTWCYDEEDEDFTKDATALDIWVLDQLKTLFQNATSDPVLADQLKADQTVFFLHLLGLDTTGHSYRPHSKEYMNNIQVVDRIVEQTERLFAEFFGDDQTSFVFTADHGMSVIGNHGDGHPDNTRTPLIAWGAGIRGPLSDSTPSSHDEYSQPWGLGHLLRRDVEQADIASLMASLIGIKWPVNSVGILPDTDPTRPGYLAPRGGNETLAEAALVNAKVLLEHYRVKDKLKRERTLSYRPFEPLEGGKDATVPPRVVMMENIESAVHARDWEAVRRQSSLLIETVQEGLRYLQTYDRFLIRAIVTVAYIGWSAYSSLYIFRPLEQTARPTSTRASLAVTFSALLVLFTFWIILAMQQSPWTFYLYIAFPCYFWQQFLVQMSPMITVPKSIPIRNILQALLIIGALQSMVAAYTHRQLWSYGLVVIGVLWPLYAWPRELFTRRRGLSVVWAVSCLVMAIFPLLPVDKKESPLLICFGAVAMIVCTACLFPYSTSWRAVWLISGQCFLISLSLLVTSVSIISLRAKQGLPTFCQVAGWLLLVISPILPFLVRVRYHSAPEKVLTYFLGFGPCLVFLSISIEGLFYVVYTYTLITWAEVESTLRGGVQQARLLKTNEYKFRPDDLRIALFFLFFVQVAFFGTGNVASISSFYLEPVYRLVPKFNPFLMASLLIFKIVVPYIVLSVIFATLNALLRLPPFSLFIVSLALTDGMTLTFFYRVSDTGSWLEIGQSISFFCITSLLLLWSAGICAAGEYLMADVLAYFYQPNDSKII